MIASFNSSTSAAIKVQIDPVTAANGVTFGHVFVKGDVPATSGLSLRTPAGQLIPVQIDNKATSSGSLRYAVLSTMVPANTGGSFELIPSAPLGTSTPRNVSELLNSGFDAIVTIKTSDNRTLTASARTLFQNKVSRWLDGPIVTEWETSGPIGDDPHLAVRFNVRSYAGVAGERVDVVIENNWTVIENPRVFTTSNVTYDVDISVRGASVYAKTGLTHYRQARWRKVFSTLTEIAPRYDSAYLKKTGAVPNYDPALRINEASLAAWSTRSQTLEPMSNGMIQPYMPTTGGRPDIGVLPAWTAGYVISMDPRTRQAVLAMSNAAASFSIHYRDKNSDRPISLITYPDITILGNSVDTRHPFPLCSGDCTNSTLVHDSAHQPSMAYMPYLITGDHFHLEELQFWANYNVVQYNPGYRLNELGIVKSDQVRGQAWTLRTLGHAALLSPDSDSFKGYFTQILENNFTWYQNNLVTGPSSNNLGVDNYGAVVYLGNKGYAPWQDDFFTSAISEVVAMGFDNGKSLLAFKAASPVERMLDMCWIAAASYQLAVRPASTGVLYQNFGEVARGTFDSTTYSSWKNSVGNFIDLPCGDQQMADFLTEQSRIAGASHRYVVGEMIGYASGAEGYPSNMQPALAASVDAKLDRANDAWSLFINRTVKPNDYGSEPQFAIVPR
ncbi:MAG: hypothetical protein HY308_17275 [Gammaproteobacteria bacterium]|nr:hypothetical protein [Gammaproteobacteria bacterium]